MALAAVLMLLDQNTRLLVPLRSALHTVTAPIYVAAEVPYSAAASLESLVFMLRDNDLLRERNLTLAARVQRTAALEAENARLRELLGSSGALEREHVFAELVGVVPNPQTREVIVSLGDVDGAFEGQAVLSADGLVGQVVETGRSTSRVLLLTDLSHATPVEVQRNGLRFVAQGTGDPDRLELRFVPNTADLAVGDLLLSSGLGLRFPAGYPVATVDEVVQAPAEPFAIVRASPIAEVERLRHVLLVRDAAQPRLSTREADGGAPVASVDGAAGTAEEEPR